MRATTEEVHGPHVTGIPVTAAFAEGDHHGGVLTHIGISPAPISMIFCEKPSTRSSFEEAGWPSRMPSGFTIETTGSVSSWMSGVEIVDVLIVLAQLRVRRDLAQNIGERIADVAEGRGFTVFLAVIPAFAVALPRDVMLRRAAGRGCSALVGGMVN